MNELHTRRAVLEAAVLLPAAALARSAAGDPREKVRRFLDEVREALS